MKQRSTRMPGKEHDELDYEMQTLMKKFLYEVYKQVLYKRLKKSDLARLTGVSPSYLSQLFHGVKPVTFEMLIRFQRALNITFEIEVLTDM